MTLAQAREAAVVRDMFEEAIEQERCNACGLPRREWGPVCSRMTQGDWTHYHSPAFWQQKLAATLAATSGPQPDNAGMDEQERVDEYAIERWLVSEMRLEVAGMWDSLLPWRWRAYFRHWSRFRQLRRRYRRLSEAKGLPTE